MQEYNKNIGKFYLYKIFSNLELVLPIYVIFLLSNNLNMLEVMLLQSIYTIVTFISEIPSGMFSDKYGRKLSLTLSSLLLSLTFVIFFLGNNFTIFLLAAIIWGLSQSLKSGADNAFLYDSLVNMRRKKNYIKIGGKAGSIEMITLGLSSLIGAYLSTQLEIRTLFLITASIFFISTLIALTFKEPKIKNKTKNNLNKTIRFTYQNKVIKHFILFFSIYGAFAYLLYYIIQPYFNQWNKIILGIAVGGYFLFTALGSYLSHKIPEKFKKPSMILLISALVFVSLSLNLKYLSVTLVFINSFISGLIGIFVLDKINSHSKSEVRATILSALNMTQKGFYTFLGPVAGFLIDNRGISEAFIYLGIMILIFFLYFSRKTHEI